MAVINEETLARDEHSDFLSLGSIRMDDILIVLIATIPNKPMHMHHKMIQRMRMEMEPILSIVCNNLMFLDGGDNKNPVRYQIIRKEE